MAKTNKTIIALIALMSLGVLTGCNTKKENSSNTQPEQSEQSSSEAKPQRGDENWVDYVKGDTVKLTLDYKNRDFYKDGIGEVTLKTAIDGDTAHFNPVVTTTSRLAIKSRYYGIDTPESTGRIQPWGKPASNFNKERLKAAAEHGTIVVSSAQDGYGVPQYDSTGERFVSLIWINEEKKNANYDELYLLNLAIVQEGYSWVKNVTDMPSYANTFYAAETQAKKYKLNLFSGEDDPTYPKGGYINTSLLDLKVATENYIKDPTYQSELDGSKVRVHGTVAGYSNSTMYLQSFFSEEDSEEIRGQGNGVVGGEYASINVFCGMSSVPSKYRKINTFIELCVFAVYSENFGFQLTGAEGHFPIVASEAKDDDCKILLTADENTDDQQLHVLEYTSTRLSQIANSGDFECLNCAVKVTDAVTCNDFYINTKGDEITLGFAGCKFSAYITFPYAGDPEKKFEYWNTEEQFVGKKFLLSGIYTYHQAQSGKISYQIVFNDATGLEWVPEQA